jgi:hypothetical protein
MRSLRAVAPGCWAPFNARGSQARDLVLRQVNAAAKRCETGIRQPARQGASLTPPTGRATTWVSMPKLSLAQARQLYIIEGRPLDSASEAALKADARPGAKAIFDAVARRRFDNRSEDQRLRKLLCFASKQWEAGLMYVARVDEAGKNPLAVPVSPSGVR